ncbi:MAG TPA: hypothetical protein HA222_00755 [Candidatus Diapherotrites archaeon]|uniref:Uncharacterized protein n=1 Tax=Candidatus Iainarchaeum sp. TaxID=3101447 RepID=A0A7J4JWY8_9ARCH|nr:hypothetical protein [Candidatus Diapherotrites archaeon]
MVALRRKFRREPKGLADFEKTYDYELKRKLETEFMPGRFGERAFHITRERLIEAVSNIKNLLPNNSGAGSHFLLPLTASFSYGEFLKGALKTIAPKARVSFLVTPTASYESMVYSKERLANLEGHLRKCLRKDDRQIVLVDDAVSKRRTTDSIAYTLKKIGFNGEYREHFANVSGTMFERSLVGMNDLLNALWRKDKEGKFAADLGNWANYMKKHNPETAGYENALGDERHKARTKRLKFYRRELYNLGIAAGREFLRQQAEKR